MVGLRSLFPPLLFTAQVFSSTFRLVPRQEIKEEEIQGALSAPSDVAINNGTLQVANIDAEFDSAMDKATALADIGDPVTINNMGCRCFPGDRCWPSDTIWSHFNSTVGGRLIQTVPIASPCHDNSPQGVPYNAAVCGALQDAWLEPNTHIETSSSIMSPFFANMSCDPFTAREDRCVLGTYVRYAVKATSALDVKLAVLFALVNNIRLVIRNTGHDLLGKSTGAGALAIWTHHLKDIKIHDYNSASYRGKALTVGAGVQVGEALEAAHAECLVIVGGDSSNVGLAGGYSQGGGHGPLVSKFGLAADQVLEWEVVTATGLHVTASANENPDLYWALAGGGGGIYGVVVSATVKAHGDSKVSVASLSFLNAEPEAFYRTIQVFLASLTNIIDQGAVAIWLLTSDIFMINSVTAPGKTPYEVQELLQDTLDKLASEDLEHQFAVKEFPTFLDSYHSMSAEPAVTAGNFGGRLLPRSLFNNTSSVASVVESLRFIAGEGGIVSGVSMNVGKKPSIPNSVNPAWRDTAVSTIIGSYWKEGSIEENIKDQAWIRNTLVPKLADLTPRGGTSYLNEADFAEPNWQSVFYGTNYDKLRDIKRKYDPLDTFYALTGVGSDDWETKSDGRLCRVW